MLPEDQIRQNATSQQDADEKKLADEFYVALHGGMKRDTLDNSGVPFTGEVLEESAKRFDDLIDDSEFLDSLKQI
jgi:hypothetical protein